MMNCIGRDEKLRNKHWRNGLAELVGHMFCTGLGFYIVEYLLICKVGLSGKTTVKVCAMNEIL